MPLTYTINSPAIVALATMTSGTLSATTGDLITIIGFFADNGNATAWTVSNTGTAITWTKQLETNTASNCKIVMWSGIAGATPPTTVSVQATAGAQTAWYKNLVTIVHTGQHATTPLPAGNLFLITSGTDISKAITPTASGSALWLAGGDWAAMNTFSAGTSCTLGATAVHQAGEYTGAVVRPTTQPRTDASAFTLSLLDTGGTVIGIAFEVQAAAGGGGSPVLPTVNDTLNSITEFVDMRMHLKNTAANDVVSATDVPAMKMHLQNTSANDVVNATDVPTMHMPISLRMEKLS